MHHVLSENFYKTDFETNFHSKKAQKRVKFKIIVPYRKFQIDVFIFPE